MFPFTVPLGLPLGTTSKGQLSQARFSWCEVRPYPLTSEQKKPDIVSSDSHGLCSNHSSERITYTDIPCGLTLVLIDIFSNISVKPSLTFSNSPYLSSFMCFCMCSQAFHCTSTTLQLCVCMLIFLLREKKTSTEKF